MIMQGGIKLALFIGTMLPVPAPPQAVEALSSVKVEAGSGETQSGFELNERSATGFLQIGNAVRLYLYPQS